MNFCSNCGSANVSLIVPKNDDRLRYVCPDCDIIHYENPKIIVGTIPVVGDKILLCKRAIEPQIGKWTLPGGYMENGETTEEGAIRETWEEATAKVTIKHLHTVYSIPHVNQVYLFFLSDLTSSYAPGPESLDVQLFEEKDIPWGELVFSSTRYALRAYFNDKEAERTHIATYAKGEH